MFAVSAPPDDVKTDEVDETAEAVGNMTGDVTVTKETAVGSSTTTQLPGLATNAILLLWLFVK